MKKTQPIVDLFTQKPYLVAIIIAFFYIAFYIRGIQLKYSMVGDMVGRWVQVFDLLNKPLFDYSCNYNQSFDPMMEYYPAPEHFFFLKNGQCIHAYPYPYAFLAAPFVKWLPNYGFYLLNSIFWLGYIVCYIYLTRLFYNRKNPAALLAGLSAFMVLPTGIYFFDYSEVILTMFLSAISLILVFVFLEKRPKSNHLLIIAGIISGFAMVLRPENVILFACLVIALFIDRMISEKPEQGIIRYLFSGPHFMAGLGLLLGFGLSSLYHQLSFDSFLPARIGNPKSIPDATLTNKLNTIKSLLIGGNKGLFSSLPFTLLSFLYFLPAVRKQLGQRGRILALTYFLTAAIIIIITPGDGGYSWSPRYLSVVLFPAAFLIFSIFNAYTNQLQKKPIRILLGLLLLYSLSFTHAGMKILHASSKQIANYHKVIESQNPDILIEADDSLYGMMSKKRLKENKIYLCKEPEQILEFIEKYQKTQPLQSFTYMWYSIPNKKIEYPTQLLSKWQLEKKGFFYNLHFDKFTRKNFTTTK